MSTTDERALLLQQFRMILQSVKTHFAQVERQTGVGGSKIWALSLVHANPGMGVGDLAKAMCIRQPTASQMVKQLHLLGHLVVKPHPNDGRALQLSLSLSGCHLLDKAPTPYAGVLPQAIDELDDQTVERLRIDLDKLSHLMGANTASATTPLDTL
jgi:DNA-binding MarR family transcriptional regulator